MPREATFWVPLGYSPIWRADGTGSFADQLQHLREVLGDFETISFQTFRLGEGAFQITINRRGMPPPQNYNQPKMNLTETVSGMVGDQLLLKNGETLIIEKFTQASYGLELRFLSNK